MSPKPWKKTDHNNRKYLKTTILTVCTVICFLFSPKNNFLQLCINSRKERERMNKENPYLYKTFDTVHYIMRAVLVVVIADQILTGEKLRVNIRRKKTRE